MTDHIKILAAELNQPADRVKAAVELIDAGNTIPFIARYRKEATGSMDDQVLRQLADRLEYLRGLDDRRAAVKEAIEAQGALTDALAAALDKAATLAELEDLYRPYKPKRKTRASMAKARGLEPLAERLLRQQTGDDPLALAADYIGEEVPDAEAALAGARDIIAEMASDNASLRARLRTLYESTGLVVSKAAKEEDSVYSSYYDFSQSAAKIAGHRVLALDRGEREGFLKVTVEVDEAKALDACLRPFLRNQSLAAAQVKLAVEDGYSRLLQPSLERELRAALTQKAAEGAIQVFGENLRQLLLAPPIKGKVAMGLDPGYRMGCKVAVVDATGKVLDTAVVYPVPEFKRVDAAKRTIKEMIRRHKVEIIAIGNGTAGRETELFAAEVIREMDMPVSYMVVSEAGASVLFRQQAGGRGIPRIRRQPAQRRFHCPAAPGPPGRAGQDRPQGRGRGPVPARHAPGPAGCRSGRRGGGLRKHGGCGPEHRQRSPAGAGGGPDQDHRQKYCEISGGERRICQPPPAAQGERGGPQGL